MRGTLTVILTSHEFKRPSTSMFGVRVSDAMNITGCLGLEVVAESWWKIAVKGLKSPNLGDASVRAD